MNAEAVSASKSRRRMAASSECLPANEMLGQSETVRTGSGTQVTGNPTNQALRRS